MGRYDGTKFFACYCSLFAVIAFMIFVISGDVSPLAAVLLFSVVVIPASWIDDRRRLR